MGTKIIRYLLGVGLVGIGVVLGLTIENFYHISSIEAINLIDLATLVVTIFLAVYIPEVLDRKLQIKKDKKDLLEERIGELQALYRKANLLIQGERPIKQKEYLSIKNTLDICEHKLDTIITLINISKLDVSFREEIQQIKTLCTKHKELVSSPKVENDGYYYSEEVQEKEEEIYSKIDEATCLIIFKISEA